MRLSLPLSLLGRQKVPANVSLKIREHLQSLEENRQEDFMTSRKSILELILILMPDHMLKRLQFQYINKILQMFIVCQSFMFEEFCYENIFGFLMHIHL